MHRAAQLRSWCALTLFLSLALVAAPVGSRAQSAQTKQDFATQPHIGPPEEALVGLIVTNRSEGGTVQTRHGNGIFLRCDGFVLAPEALFSVRNAPDDKVGKIDQTVVVVLHPGTAQEKQIAVRRPRDFVRLDAGDRYYQMTYAVLKVSDVHVPSPRALLPEALPPGTPLKVIWSAWSDMQSRFLPPQTVVAAVGTRAASDPINGPPGPAPTQKDSDPKSSSPLNSASTLLSSSMPSAPTQGANTGTVVADPNRSADNDAAIAKQERPIPLFVRQTTVFTQPLQAAIRGAVVIGPESMLVGMVTEAAETGATRFANFDSLDKATNCIAALPSTEAQYTAFQQRLARGEDPTADPKAKARVDAAQAPAAGDPPDGGAAGQPLSLRAQSDMVSVPGGPLTLPTLLEDYQPDMESQSLACIPPFQIDRYEVTNAQYLEFWNALPAKQRKDANVRASLYPYGWGDESAPFPAEMATVPVLGVRLAGAKAYAKWVGKRLPTPYEWCLAAFGPEGGNRPPAWARKFIQARQEAWQKIVQAHLEYARAHPEILPGSWADHTVNGILTGTVVPDRSRPLMEEFLQLPWFFMRPDFGGAAAWSKQCVKQFTDPLFQEWVDPMYVLPVGSRPYDVSPYGAADMLMNARELVLPGPQQIWHVYPRNWGYKEVDRYMEVDWTVGNTVQSFSVGQGVMDTGYTPKLLESAVPDRDGYFLANMDAYLKPSPSFNVNFMNTNMLISHPGHFIDQNKKIDEHMEPGLAFTNFPLPLTSLTAPNPPEFDSKLLGLDHTVYNYTFRMPSRRIHSAAQNAHLGNNGFVLADLGDYVKICAAVQEYTELLRPVDSLTLNLVAGPTFEVPYWASTGTFGYLGAYDPGIPKEQYQSRRSIIQNGGTIRRELEASFGLASTGHRFYWYADATQISLTGAYAAWANGPEHFHYEMGRPLAVDAHYPVNSRSLDVSNGATSYSPDTFLIPGGFRCAR